MGLGPRQPTRGEKDQQPRAPSPHAGKQPAPVNAARQQPTGQPRPANRAGRIENLRQVHEQFAAGWKQFAEQGRTHAFENSSGAAPERRRQADQLEPARQSPDCASPAQYDAGEDEHHPSSPVVGQHAAACGRQKEGAKLHRRNHRQSFRRDGQIARRPQQHRRQEIGGKREDKQRKQSRQGRQPNGPPRRPRRPPQRMIGVVHCQHPLPRMRRSRARIIPIATSPCAADASTAVAQYHFSFDSFSKSTVSGARASIRLVSPTPAWSKS